MVRSSSINADVYKCAGLALGNACVALSGGLVGQSLSFFDAGYGSGMVVIGLASVIIGETIVGRRSVTTVSYTHLADYWLRLWVSGSPEKI